jgi:GTP pyrophosphokinase
MHNDEVFCFTPNGDIFNLQIGSTVLDFAYAIHSEVGNNCISAKVNGAIAPLRQRLENGDQVEILTTKNSRPSPNWLQFVQTSKAKTSIRNFIRIEKFNEYSSLGKAILQKYFLAKNVDFNENILEKAIAKFNKKTIDDLCFKVADGTISRQEIFKTIYPDFEKENQIIKSPKNKINHKISSHSLPIEGLVDGMAIRFAGCCNPIPGDPIVGVINTGTGVSIHNQMCSNLKNLALNPQRILDVCWKSEEQIGDQSYQSQIRVVVENISGAIAEITNIIAKKKMNIRHITTTNRSSETFEVLINVSVKNVDHLEQMLSALRMSKKTIEVERLAGVFR